MSTPQVSAVTGAFGFTGGHIARRLLGMGHTVRTLTGHPDRPDPFGGRVAAARLDFDRPRDLVASLRGATTLYNTYWVRFQYRHTGYDTAVAASRILIDSAGQAGVQKIVHVSIANPAEDSPFPYFRGKALVERYLSASGLDYAIVRPTVMFGSEAILVNNIAWLLRRCPVFALPGGGGYRLQPVDVADVAALAVDAAAAASGLVIDAAGPEVFSFDRLVRMIARAVRSRAKIVPVPPGVALGLSRVVGRLVGDVVLTRDEVDGLMAGLLVSHRPALAQSRFSDWLERHGDRLGRRYMSELARHFR